MIPATPATGMSFRRKKSVRLVAGAASAGVLAAMSLVGASSASAATAADCTVTIDSATGDALTIQQALDASNAVICLTGTFVLPTPLSFTYGGATILGLSNAVLDGDNNTPILEANGSNLDITVQNLTLQNGSSVDPNVAGGITAFRVTAIDSSFLNNTSTHDGGAIVGGNTVTATGSTFTGNHSDGAGGAISVQTATINGSTFTNNTADSSGGAISAYNIQANTSTFTENTAENSGGALDAYSVTTDSSTFDMNTSTDGGAIDAYGVQITNSTFVGNSVTDGGEDLGGAVWAITGSILQSTFLNNETDGGIGEAVFWANPEFTFTLRGNLFIGDGTRSQLGVTTDDTFTDLGGNIFSTDIEPALGLAQTSTSFNVPASALFVTSALGNNGGPTQTVALSGTSPAIDHVPAPGDTDPFVTVDQRGVPRTTLSDSGAYEYDAPAALAATGLVPNGWLGGAAALLLAMGAGVFALSRKVTRIR